MRIFWPHLGHTIADRSWHDVNMQMEDRLSSRGPVGLNDVEALRPQRMANPSRRGEYIGAERACMLLIEVPEIAYVITRHDEDMPQHGRYVRKERDRGGCLRNNSSRGYPRDDRAERTTLVGDHSAPRFLRRQARVLVCHRANLLCQSAAPGARSCPQREPHVADLPDAARAAICLSDNSRRRADTSVAVA